MRSFIVLLSTLIAFPLAIHGMPSRRGLQTAWRQETYHDKERPQRLLMGANLQSPDMLPAKCFKYCEHEGYKYAGIESGMSVLNILVARY
jgi:hypothetical protein